MKPIFYIDRTNRRRIKGYLFGIKIFSWPQREDKKIGLCKRIARHFFSVKHLTDGNVHVSILGIDVFHFHRDLQREECLRLQKNYEQKRRKLTKQVKQGRRLKIAFMVGTTSMFPARQLFELLLKTGIFDVSLIIIPEYRFDVKAVMERTLKELAEFKSVTYVSPLEPETDTLDLNAIADVIVPALPYDISHSKYSLPNLIEQGLLPVLLNYSYYWSNYGRKLIASPRFSQYWKIFIESPYAVEEYKTCQIIKGKNAVLSGYAKMDALANVVTEKKDRKTLILAPHHSLPGGYNGTLWLANFLEYADFFLTLPDRYPQIDFIFRPHPALFSCLEKKEFWGEERARQYLETMLAKPNVIYSDGGDYFHDFAISDGIIHDCGSYLVEYYYTKKPHCFILRGDLDIDNQFGELGKLCLENTYIAQSHQHVLDFIDKVIIGGDDPMKEQRIQLAENSVMINYPHATREIARHLAECFSLKVDIP